MNRDKAMREELIALLRGGNAHIGFDEMIADFPLKEMNTPAEKVIRPPDEPATPWHLLEHMRLVQKDILEFVRDPKYVSPEYPDGYWPAPDQKADKKKWDRSVRSFQSDLEAVLEIVTDPKTELSAPSPMPKTTSFSGKFSWSQITTHITSGSSHYCRTSWEEAGSRERSGAKMSRPGERAGSPGYKAPEA